MMGTWEPVSAAMEWWLPLWLSGLLALAFFFAAWPYRKQYPRILLAFHLLYIVWFMARAFSAIFTYEHISTVQFFLRLGFAFLGTILVAIGYFAARDRTKWKVQDALAMNGPDEVLWSPDPIVGYRVTIHSLQGEVYHGGRAHCRYWDLEISRHPKDEVPNWGCRCGYYAYKTKESASPSFAIITFLWGRVIECEDGYRAEYMRPIGYWAKDRITKVTARALSVDEFFQLPVAATEAELEALIKKARESFDAEAPPPYDWSHNGHRKADTED